MSSVCGVMQWDKQCLREGHCVEVVINHYGAACDYDYEYWIIKSENKKLDRLKYRANNQFKVYK